MMNIDLLDTIEYGGCSAKIPASRLDEVLGVLPKTKNEKLLVDIDTHDDAGVYLLNDDIALIQTVDFFPPVCSDPYEFGQIAAANALSDVYAMGGTPITALNLVMFPYKTIPLDALGEILRGGMDKVAEAKAIIVGGHTIDDYPPKYGLAVTGTVSPDNLVTNADARVGDVLILTKPLGTGLINAGRRIKEVSDEDYENSLDTMKLLNKASAVLMNKFGVRCATDITGFGLLGHALKLAMASGVKIVLNSEAIPILPGAYKLLDMGCIPGVAFRNQDFVGDSASFESSVDYNRKMLMFDAQTSGGILMAVSKDYKEDILKELKRKAHPDSSIIGEITLKDDKYIRVI